jgi:hypothetical protein
VPDLDESQQKTVVQRLLPHIRELALHAFELTVETKW